MRAQEGVACAKLLQAASFKCKRWLYFLAQLNFVAKFCTYVNPKPPSQAHPHAWPLYASALLQHPWYHCQPT